MKFQIRLIDKSGCGFFLYFEGENDNKEEMACKTANEYLRKRRERDEFMRGSFFYQSYKPFKVISVVEFDNEKKITKRGGLKFKIKLDYFELKVISGRKIRDEWYKPINTIKHK